MSYIPRGCDQQGRHPQAAEACTELGVEEPDNDSISAVLVDALIALCVLAVIGLIVIVALGL